MEIINRYFNAWNRHDLEELSNIFDDNICLKDWNISANGKARVLDCNKEIFETHKNIKVTVSRVYEVQDVFFCEVLVHTDEGDLRVLDKIALNSNKIIQISAFKQ